jgi:hypothetical protein
MFTAAVEIAGPFKIESKPLSIAVAPGVPTAEKYAKPPSWIAVVLIVVIAALAAGLAIHKKKATT